MQRNGTRLSANNILRRRSEASHLVFAQAKAVHLLLETRPDPGVVAQEIEQALNKAFVRVVDFVPGGVIGSWISILQADRIGTCR